MSTESQITVWRNVMTGQRQLGNRPCVPRWLRATVLGLLGLGVMVSPANAQDTINLIGMQKAPGYFKFQAQVSRGKLPVGDAVFREVWVNLVNGTSVEASEQLSQVVVRDGVLNLEIGRTNAVVFEQKIAQFPQLQVQVCIEQQTNCLQAVPIASVPYAIKASYAYNARYAANAAHATECDYTHRASADAQNWTGADGSQVGYFDFEAPQSTNVAGLVIQPTTNRAGFIQWRPINTTASEFEELHLCAQEETTGQRKPLDKLVMQAVSSEMSGTLAVRGRITAAGGLTVSGGGVSVTSGGLSVTGGNVVVGTAGTSGGSSTTIYGPATFGSSGTSNQTVFNGPVQFNQGFTTAQPTYTAAAPVTLSGTTIGFSACANNQVMRHNGTRWACANITKFVVLRQSSSENGQNSPVTGEVEVNCPAGSEAIGGGCTAYTIVGSDIRYNYNITENNVRQTWNGLTPVFNGWECKFRKNETLTGLTVFNARVVCGDTQ